MRHINFDLQQLQAFIAVAERGSFRAAADHIHLSPPALSRRIEKLESIIGTRLFNRTTREVELTSIGRIFLDRARAAIDDLESAILGISDIAATRSGRVTVACVPSAALYFLPHVISSFSVKYPSIRIRVIDESMNQTLQSVLTGESDFGIGFMNTLMPEITFEGIHNDPFVVAMRRDHALSSRKSVNWAHIENERLISVARSSGNRQLLDDVMSKMGLLPNFAFEVSHIGTLLGMVEAGLGIAAVPRTALPTNHPVVIGLPLKNPSIARSLGLLRKQGSTLRPAAAMFHDHLFEALQKRKISGL
ncbi:LysR family transcriptional regulator [Limnohabitans sp. 15K]|jgi:DNA-binding transcriptional LysR family regulator|uniref:LysR family transcriptional regulator n=1 Tax=Limnohabitans sp. 15K TaxID=1100706 RepID=UPI000C1E996A|nr:LysR family transcriptional regulator [Limnohabitans sp. 15K]PIT83286.1 LysR family transcriptional regulator [Limnohabitans sp. 15K]